MKKFISVFLVFAMVLSLAVPCAATTNETAANLVVSETGTTVDLYENRASETISFDDETYTFSYYYENDNRVIRIENNESHDIDLVTYNLLNDTIYLNGQIIGVKNDCSNTPIPADTNGWETLSVSDHTISWLLGTATSIVAAAIAAKLGKIGVSAVKIAIGQAMLEALANYASGGQLHIDSQWYHVTPNMPQYRMVWTFTSTANHVCGPYISHYSA